MKQSTWFWTKKEIKQLKAAYVANNKNPQAAAKEACELGDRSYPATLSKVYQLFPRKKSKQLSTTRKKSNTNKLVNTLSKDVTLEITPKKVLIEDGWVKIMF